MLLMMPLELAVQGNNFPPLPCQPWIPIDAFINSVNTARPELEPDVVSRDAVINEGTQLMPYWLFPAIDPLISVWVHCEYNSPIKWGIRPLLPTELSTMWDVPIVLQEWLQEFSAPVELLALMDGITGKVLLLGGITC